MNGSDHPDCPDLLSILIRLGEVPDVESHRDFIGYNSTTNTIPEMTLQNASSGLTYLSINNDSTEGDPDRMSCSNGQCPVDIFKSYVRRIGIPIFSTVGIIGNILNVFVLTRERFQSFSEGRNKSCALLGLISLALSDMLYCVAALPEAFMEGERILFRKKDAFYFYQNYHVLVKNFFYYLSIWLTVLMAVSRYCAICKLQQSRHWRETKNFVIALCTLVTVWGLLLLPTFWTHQVTYTQCPTYNFSLYVIDTGPYVRNRTMQQIFSNIYTVAGFFIPMVILSYCNVHLIRALRESERTRNVYRVHDRNNRNCNRITPTLVAVICMFLICCSPAEILSFWFYKIDKSKMDTFSVLLIIGNLLKTINFSMNFLLYCLINSHFRSTLKHALACGHRRLNARRRSSSSRCSNKKYSLQAYQLSHLNLSTVTQQSK